MDIYKAYIRKAQDQGVGIRILYNANLSNGDTWSGKLVFDILAFISVETLVVLKHSKAMSIMDIYCVCPDLNCYYFGYIFLYTAFNLSAYI